EQHTSKVPARYFCVGQSGRPEHRSARCHNLGSGSSPVSLQAVPDDLFEAALQQRLAERAPLPARMRPRNLDQMGGQPHLLGPAAPLRALIETDRLSSIILWGPPGTGKTTLASVIASQTDRHFIALSAVTAGVKDVRQVIEDARRRLGEDGKGTILFLD